MIRHILLLKWKPETTASQITATLADIDTLKDLPFIKSVRYGHSLGLVADSYHLVVEMVFEREADWHGYLTDPHHEEVAARLRPLISQSARIQIPLA